jgi:hypothetical protein
MKTTPKPIRLRAPLLPLIVALGLSPLLACADDPEITPIEGSSIVTLAVNGLQKIVGGLNYHAWLVVGDASNYGGYPLLVFNIDDEGRMVDPAVDTVLSGPYEVGVAADAVLGLAVTLEITNVLLASSSFTFILGGEMIDGVANLTAEDWIAFNRDLSDADGQFVLFSPTDEDPTNELSGIWFLDSSETLYRQGLILPEAPNGWNYEGWIEVGGHTLSTGKFLFPNLPDSTANFSGPLEGPSFPGEDFLVDPPEGLTFPLDLSGGTVFVTVEPEGEWDAFPDEPFYIRLLEGTIPENPVAMVLYGMTSLVSELPTGTATVQGL